MLAMIWWMLMCAPFNVSAADAPDAKPVFGVFTNPQPVTGEGYSQDAMEPFIRPDGNYLLQRLEQRADHQPLLRDANEQRSVQVRGRDCWCERRSGDAHRRSLDGHERYFLFHLEQEELRADLLDYLFGDLFQRQPV